MNVDQMKRIKEGKGFIAALDQSGGSTPKALLSYGIKEDSYSNAEEMFDIVHAMRTRIITSPAFTSDQILGAILFKNTMNRDVEGLPTSDYLWERKGIVPFLKVDEGLAAVEDGVQLMKPFSDLEGLLESAIKKNIFGTKMRSVIKEANPEGIRKIVEQQFAYGKQIAAMGLIPILEPEVDIHSETKQASETMLKKEILKALTKLAAGTKFMFKVTIPSEADFYRDLMGDTHVLRVVALSGGYTRNEANAKLAQNHGLIASFSRALAQGLSVDQTDEAFDATLGQSIKAIYEASIT